MRLSGYGRRRLELVTMLVRVCLASIRAKYLNRLAGFSGALLLLLAMICLLTGSGRRGGCRCKECQSCLVMLSMYRRKAFSTLSVVGALLSLEASSLCALARLVTLTFNSILICRFACRRALARASLLGRGEIHMPSCISNMESGAGPLCKVA